jgi:hypothetical protein
MMGGNYVLTKDLTGAAGPDGTSTMNSADFSMASAVGEALAGDGIANPGDKITSGYFGGRFGNSQTFQLLSSQVGQPGTRTFFQNALQVGVPFDAPVTLAFSDQLDASTVANSLQVSMATDHLGNPSGSAVPVTLNADPLGQSVSLLPQSAWPGNTLYDVQITPQLRNIDGVPLDQTYHLYYLTMLDIHQENMVTDPLSVPNLPAGVVTGPIEAMSIHLPADSLSDYSAVLSSRDPLNAPLHVDPAIIQEANRKALAAGGAYRTPLALQEINAYHADGTLVTALSKPASLSINYGGGMHAEAAGAGLVRPQTLSLYILDQTHQLWVKIPAGQNSSGFHTLSAPVSQLSVFALMGSADGSASDSYVFPNPWRPHGPKAGGGAGQTGTESDGMMFTNLPSECTIKIYSLAGDLVRQIAHSDTGGLIAQEKWDGKTAHGDPAASGVYLWRVESSVDGKNGKLMIIR